MAKHALAFPILYLNLSGEMMYIIEQRLEAQNVVRDKSIKGNNIFAHAPRIFNSHTSSSP